MKNLFTRTYRRKNVGDPDGAFSVALCLLGLTFLLFSSSSSAQTGEKPTAPSNSAGLPRPFAQFSTSDVLKQISPGYDPATGRMSGIINKERKPALVQIEKTGLWKVQGQDHLVVLVGVIADDDGPAGLCGNCLMNSFLAVLKKRGTALSLVARQLTLPTSGAPVEDESLDPNEVIEISGHDNVALDLAPYNLNNRETLIGVRLEHIWLPTSDWSTSLSLYRIEGERLREVFRAPVVERVYPADSDRNGRTVEKTTSTISCAPARQPTNHGFNDLVINKITVRCFNKDRDEDCDSKHEGFRQIRTQTELWQFDGQRYVHAAPLKR
ncbi:MAG: hypothetical protein LC754_06590 [Acidobacteria bacterium]|nr:hypothetical protein [Acidobacteriota bacterium]